MREINVPLLLKVKEAILAQPEHFYMGFFVNDEMPLRGDGTLAERVAEFQQIAKDLDGVSRDYHCSTTLCIAGWAVALAPPGSLPVNVGNWQSMDYYCGEVAPGLLGLSESQYESLFFSPMWPEDLRDLYDAAVQESRPGEMARVGALMIDRFIAEHAPDFEAANDTPTAP